MSNLTEVTEHPGDQNQARDSQLPVHPPSLIPLSHQPGCVGPFFDPLYTQNGTRRGEGACPPFHSGCPDRKVCTGASRGAVGGAVYIMYILSASLKPLHLASTAQAGEGEGRAKAGLTSPRCAPPLPAPPPGPGVTRRPPQKPRGPGGRKQELGLPYFAHWIQLLFCIVFL